MSRLKDYLTTIAGSEEKAIALVTTHIGSEGAAKELLDGKLTLSPKLSEKLAGDNADYDADTAVQLSKADHVDYTKANAKGEGKRVTTGKSPAFGNHDNLVRARTY